MSGKTKLLKLTQEEIENLNRHIIRFGISNRKTTKKNPCFIAEFYHTLNVWNILPDSSYQFFTNSSKKKRKRRENFPTDSMKPLLP